MRGFYLLLFLAFVVNVTALGQNAGDYRSATSGPWNQAGTWETFDGVSWNPAVAAPTNANGAINITAFTIVDVTTSVTADEILVEGDGVLNVQSGGNLTVAAGVSGLTVTEGDGFFTTDGFLNVLTGGTLTGQQDIVSTAVNAQIDGTYNHARNGGTIPTASWNNGSLLLVTGITNNTPVLQGLAGQSFYDLTWNTNQTVAVILPGTLTDVRHNLTIANTGTAAAGTLSLTAATGGPFPPLNIGGDLTVAGNAALAFAPSSGGFAAAAYVVNIGGNVSVTSSKAIGFNVAGSNSNVNIVVQGSFTKNGATGMSLVNSAATTQNSVATLEVNGNFIWAGGTFTMAAGSNLTNTVTGNLNIGGDLTINGGSFTKTGTNANIKGVITFDDSHTHTFTSAVATPFSSVIDFSVPSSNRLNIDAASALTGTGAFNLAAGATLGISSTQGISQGTAAGSIRTNATTRTYAVNSTIIYNGAAQQVLGTEWSAGGKLNGVAVNLEINNAAGVINNPTSTNIVGALTLTNGPFDINAGTTFSIQGNFTSVSGTITGYNNSNLTFGGSGTVTGNLTFTPGSQILNNFTISRNNTIFLGSDLTINQTGVLSFSGSGNLRINGNTLTVNGDITQSGAGAIASSVNTSNLVIGGSGALTALPLCTSCGTNQFNNVTLDRSSGATYTWNSAANISGIFALNSGAFTHSSGLIMATGSTFSRSAGTTVAGVAPNATTTYNVAYNGNLTTSIELPTVASNALNNLTVAGNVVLDKNIRINGDVSITSGTLDANTRAVNMQGATFAVNGGSFTIANTATVTFARAGTTALSGSTIGNSTFGNLTINSGTTVNAPNANINITGVWTNNGTFTPNNGTVTFNGGSQNINANGQAFWNLITDLGTKTLTGNLDVNGTLMINAGSTLAGSSFNIFIADTWDNNGTFNAGTGTVTFDGASQTVDGTNTAFNNVVFANSGTKTLDHALDVNATLTINSGVTLDVSPTNYTINVAGGWTNNGTFNAGNGTVIFDGGIIQSVAGSANTQFYNITETGSSTTLTMSTPQSLINALSLQGGVFNPNGNFTLLSTASGDARIDELTGGATISATNMTVQRYLPNNASARAYRYLSSPATNATVNEWKDDFPITGPFPGHSVQAEWPSIPNINATNQSFYRYNEAHTPTSVYTDRYEAYPAAAQNITAAPLVNGVGYAAFVRQSGPITIEVVGQVATGTRNVTVTNQAGGAQDGWNLIGNPYPSPISWQNVTIPAGVGAYIGLKDNANNIGLGAGQYVYYTQGGFGIPGSYTGTIAQGQAFWVRKTTAGSTVIAFQEDDKQQTSTPPFMRNSFQDVLRLHIAGAATADELIIHFDANSRDAADDKDAYKLTNDFINFSSLSTDGADLAINSLGALSCSREIPLVLKGTAKGQYAITFSEHESFSEGVDIRLLDNYTGQTYVASDVNTIYNFQVNDDAASQNPNRFKIYIGYKELNLGVPVQASDVCIGSDAQVKIMTPQVGVTYQATINGNAVGQPMIATNSSALTLTIPNASLLATNTIVLKAKNNGCAEMPLTQSVTVKTDVLPTISLAKNATGCGAGSVTLNAEGAPEGGSYRWYLTEDATDAIDGQTASSFVTPSLSKTKTYFVSAVNSLGCEGGRVAITATIAYPVEAQITVDGLNLVSGSDTGNQWYLNGVAIPGATGKTYLPKQSGTYKLTVTTGDCSTSVEREFAVTGDVDSEILKGYVLYPNPTPGLVYVEVATSSEVAVTITNQIGVQIANGALKQEGRIRKGQFDISGYASGVYLVVIKHDNQTVTRKIVKN